MTLQMIGAGFGRTGTHSLAQALEILGFGPCYHMNAFGRNGNHLPAWQAALRGESVDWEALFSGFQSSVEWPAVAFLGRIFSAFPSAMVVLTMREAESWYESAAKTILKGLPLSVHNPNPEKRAHGAFIRQLILSHTFKDRYGDKDSAIRIYKEHLDTVRKMVPPDRLLAFDVRSGWGPLCAFLEVPAPAEPFPHRNERRAFLAQAPDWFKTLESDLDQDKD